MVVSTTKHSEREDRLTKHHNHNDNSKPKAEVFASNAGVLWLSRHVERIESARPILARPETGKIAFRSLETLATQAMRRVTPKSHIRSDEGLTRETSALESLHFADKTKYSFPLHSI